MRISEINILTKQSPMVANSNLSTLCPYDSESAEENAWFEYVLNGLSQNRAGKFKMLLSKNGSEFVEVDKSMIRTITVTLDAAHLINYDGGDHAPVIGELIAVNGDTSTEYAYVKDFTLASGAWDGGAAGVIEVHKATNAFVANLEDNDVLEDSGSTKICDVVGGIAR